VTFNAMGELEKEKDIAYFTLLAKHLPREIEQNCRNPWINGPWLKFEPNA
jgi:hypothetical protein